MNRKFRRKKQSNPPVKGNPLDIRNYETTIERIHLEPVLITACPHLIVANGYPAGKIADMPEDDPGGVLRLRGWGWIQKLDDPERYQSEVCERMAAAWNRVVGLSTADVLALPSAVDTSQQMAQLKQQLEDLRRENAELRQRLVEEKGA